MPEPDLDRLICIVAGVQLVAELGDRPLAYRIERLVRKQLTDHFGKHPKNQPPVLAPVVLSDAYYLNNDSLQLRPVISIGGPGVNALTALLLDQIPTVVAIEQTLVIQMDLDMKDPRCAIWGMTHLDTLRAVKLFIAKGYLQTFVKGVIDSFPAA
jgi:hypothetical protein